MKFEGLGTKLHQIFDQAITGLEVIGEASIEGQKKHL